MSMHDICTHQAWFGATKLLTCCCVIGMQGLQRSSAFQTKRPGTPSHQRLQRGSSKMLARPQVRLLLAALMHC